MTQSSRKCQHLNAQDLFLLCWVCKQVWTISIIGFGVNVCFRMWRECYFPLPQNLHSEVAVFLVWIYWLPTLARLLLQCESERRKTAWDMHLEKWSSKKYGRKNCLSMYRRVKAFWINGINGLWNFQLPGFSDRHYKHQTGKISVQHFAICKLLWLNPVMLNHL